MDALDFSSLTLGVLGGMGPAATANFHRLLVAEFNRIGVVEDARFPRILSLNIPLRDWDYHGALNKLTVAAQVRSGVAWLESFGAKLIAVPCNSVHEFIDSSRVVSILDATAAKLAGFGTVGVLCSAQSRAAKLYERSSGAGRFVYVENQAGVDAAIQSVLCGSGVDIGPSIYELVCLGAEVIVLGCTELSLCSRNAGVAARVVDSSEALAEAVVRRLRELV